MRSRAPLHDWDLAIPEARALQEKLAARIVQADPNADTGIDEAGSVRTVAGVDVSYDRGSPELYASVVVLDARSLHTVDVVSVRAPARFPYVPGYLSFRELPAALEAFSKLRVFPDLVVADAHGFAHPRRFGLACHLGVWLDVPTIGCAKSRLVGEHREPGPRRGARVQLRDSGQVIGSVLRTRDLVKPVYVSIGWRVSLPTACRWVLRLARGTRLPETTRRAHAEVNRKRKSGRR